MSQVADELSQKIEWVELKERFPEKGIFDVKTVIVACGQDLFIAEYITDFGSENISEKGRFYLNMRYPKRIFENITEYVDLWAEIKQPQHESMFLNDKFA